MAESDVRGVREESGLRTVASPSSVLSAVSDVGHVRANNEDAFFAADEAALLVVADGLGGLPSGEVASREAVAVAAARAVDAHALLATDAPADESARDLLWEIVGAADRRVLEVARERPECRGMATTFLATIPGSGRAWTSHVGDVRAYLVAGGRVTQITRDHSAVEELVARGTIPEAAARTHPARHLVTQALGLEQRLDPSFVVTETRPGDVLLLCSDGVWEAVEPEVLGRVACERRSAEARAIELVDRALAAGGRDNATVLLLDLG